MDMETTLLKIGEVAKTFRVDDTTVRRWIKNGALEAVALPGGGKRQGYRVRVSDVKRILGGGEQ